MGQNEVLFERAQKVIPGGVNSPVRAFRQVGGVPRFVSKASGPYFWDADNKRYIDLIMSWGPMIAGHAHPEIVEAVQKAAATSFSFGAPTEGEIELAERICSLMPSIEQIRMVSSGTEATMSALRLARGYTGRDLIVKFEGCYHGHADSLLVKAGSGLLTFADSTQNAPSSSGVPQDVVKHTLVLPYNDTAALEAVFQKQGDQIAAVILEPIAGNMNLIKAKPEFLAAARKLTSQHGAVLIYDEVMTGFRVALGGAQSLQGITPDLTCLGKVMGGGMPMAAFGGKKEIMSELAPLGAVYQAGTLSGNPVAVAAGLKTLEIVAREGFYECLAGQTQKLMSGLKMAADQASIPFAVDSVGGMFGFYFTSAVPTSFAEVTQSNIEAFKHFFHAMLDEGVYLAPSAYEAGFTSITHDNAVVDQIVKAAQKSFQKIQK
ncbi:glutamate-1-semialdehyde 2,1-aminomutase [Polynucleobacter paneuropaeus]|uniref:Glutamate-1-semialdehyde 2,1-aminomutase n=1 Tax=Polynucleobacter paneuropaeus TaxID=2527775 RepID=A0A2Z4JR18_9BURK|nr:glutamate-1-semialdehyde 2,1-aminomutase [Polynucleobacter paneuropaeus]AWW49123.1 glutamate-1-semialdehyde-2,1-aminomutase [Polynucleobacter paneuropaeus]MBT8515205.1 glutamate-1-semialdehyde 2,1-aminomutase [Polynucleobacter paneuropaeus]MBT8520077.1 glutamate-1-semialdehyde 2,1-aminomutase [Polynucleobacter paneuropaeus]MBT8530829.1 glutamate-1-semialdehyde 2,1-aminomutase [Polynucleobacter paneuropaeus]MBT8549310.1 glutamate-1-semialdehyde 2,1-aminomutase [Polynucleobacter paneuropaeus]